MNELYEISFGIALIFIVFFLAFFILREKASNMIMGYNLKLPSDRKKYDERLLSRDTGIFYLVLGLIFLLGGIGSYFWSDIAFWIALGLAVVWLGKYVLWDREKTRFDARYRRM